MEGNLLLNIERDPSLRTYFPTNVEYLFYVPGLVAHAIATT